MIKFGTLKKILNGKKRVPEKKARPQSAYIRILNNMHGMQMSPSQVKFFQSLLSLSKEYRDGFYLLIKNELNYAAVPFLRMMIDNIITVQGYMLFDNKEAYCNNFLNGNPLNRLKLNEKAFSSSTVFEITEDDELKELYKNCCKYIHPSSTSLDGKIRMKIFCGFENKCYHNKNEEREYILKRFKEVEKKLQQILEEAIKLGNN